MADTLRTMDGSEARSVFVTVMPSTGRVVNTTLSSMTLEDAKVWLKECDVNNCLSIYSIEEWKKQPICETCGCWIRLGNCSDCR